MVTSCMNLRDGHPCFTNETEIDDVDDLCMIVPHLSHRSGVQASV